MQNKNIVVKKNTLDYLALEGEGNKNCSLPPWRGKVGAARMRENLSAFTLIELLVVVLIIGILAAVAVSQYQKAVAKNKLISITVAGKTIRDGLRIFVLENGKYPKAKELDIWDSFNEEQNAYYLLGRRFFYLGNSYVRAYFPFDLTCDWGLAYGGGECVTNNKKTITMLKSMGWEVKNETSTHSWFIIPGQKNIMVP